MNEPTVEWIYGLHAVNARLRGDPAGIMELWLAEHTNSRERDKAIRIAGELGIPVRRNSKKELDQVAQGVNQGIALRCSLSAPLNEEALESILQKNKSVRFLVLDGVTDPGNLGACIRSAAAFGVSAVIVPKDRSASLNATARKAASGGADQLAFVQVTNLARCLEWLKQWGVLIVGTHIASGQDLPLVDLTGSIALVMGSEHKGVRRLTQDKCDLLVRIPQSLRQESLNVSVATGICLYEVYRQQSGA